MWGKSDIVRNLRLVILLACFYEGARALGWFA
jgi:hypothetical protein